jgi:hypothetical protein
MSFSADLESSSSPDAFRFGVSAQSGEVFQGDNINTRGRIRRTEDRRRFKSRTPGTQTVHDATPCVNRLLEPDG